MQCWLEVFKYPSVERTTYDRLECTAKNHISPELGERVISTIKSADIKRILNDRMDKGYAYRKGRTLPPPSPINTPNYPAPSSVGALERIAVGQ